MSAVLELLHASVILGGRQVLAPSSLAVPIGDFTAVVGPNGSGKSTLLRVLAGLRIPDSGDVRFRQQPIKSIPRRELARHISFLAQDTRCDFAFTVEEVVAMGRYPHRRRFEPSRSVDQVAIETAMALADVSGLRQRTVDRLSGGERQRVAIARCMATEPDVILLDEPTAHLDLQHALDIFELCRDLADRGKTVVFATHDLGSVLRYADTVVLLSAGHIHAVGEPIDVLTARACREIFAVEPEIVTTATGRQALVFDRP